MRILVVALLTLCLAVPAVAIADRGGDRHPTAASAAAKKKQKRAKKRHHGRKATPRAAEQARLQRSSAGDEREVTGTLASLDPLIVGTLTCVRPSGISLVGFAVGDRVELTCDLVGGQWVARKLEHEDGDDRVSGRDDDSDDDDDDRSGHGGGDDDDHDSSGPGGGDDDEHDD